MINVMDEYVQFNKKCFHKYLKLILDKEYNKSICDELIEAYVNVRYSNYLDEDTIKYTLDKKIEKSLDLAVERLLYELAPKYEPMIRNSRHFSSYLNELDQLYLLEAQKRASEKIYNDRVRVYGNEDSEFIKKLNDMLMQDTKKRKEYLDSFESPTFSLEYKQMGKNELKVELKYNIQFPELYSAAAIKKVAERDNINEDLTTIGFLELASVIINDLACCDFDKIYYMDLPKSFFEKKIKISRLFTVIDNVYFQDKLRLLINFECFSKFKSSVTEYMRQGFVFGIVLDETFDYSTQNTEFLELFDKILINPDKYYYKDMKNSGKIKDRIVSIVEVK